MLEINIHELPAYIVSQDIQSKILVVKIVFYALSVIFLALVIWLLVKTKYLKERYVQNWSDLRARPQISVGAKKMAKKWRKISSRLKTDSEAGWKLSIVEADNLLDSIFREVGVQGASTEERWLNVNIETVPNLEALEEGHRVSDAIIHDPDYHLEWDDAKRFLEATAEAFDHLKIF